MEACKASNGTLSYLGSFHCRNNLKGVVKFGVNCCGIKTLKQQISQQPCAVIQQCGLMVFSSHLPTSAKTQMDTFRFREKIELLQMRTKCIQLLLFVQSWC
jgi:hypothetical protein